MTIDAKKIQNSKNIFKFLFSDIILKLPKYMKEWCTGTDLVVVVVVVVMVVVVVVVDKRRATTFPINTITNTTKHTNEQDQGNQCRTF